MAKDEKFDLKKAVQALNITDPIAWMKSLSVGLRLLILSAIVAGAIFGWGYWRGKRNKPVHVDLSNTTITVVDKYGETHELVVKDNQLSFDGQVVKVKHVKELRPFGIEVHPKLAGGITSAGNPAAGLALEIAHAYNLNLDLLAMVPFIGAGISYDIHITQPIRIDNSSVGIGVGRDLKENTNAAILYYSLEF